MALSESAKIDVHSFTWIAVKHMTEEELKAARDTIERRNLEQRDTDFLRGRISLALELLQLPERDSEHVSE